MATDVGMAALNGPRDLDKVKRELEAAGYKGETAGVPRTHRPARR